MKHILPTPKSTRNRFETYGDVLWCIFDSMNFSICWCFYRFPPTIAHSAKLSVFEKTQKSFLPYNRPKTEATFAPPPRYEKTPKKLPKHFGAKYKLRTFKRTASQVPHRLESFYGAVSSTTISCRDLLDPKNFQKIQINSLKK